MFSSKSFGLEVNSCYVPIDHQEMVIKVMQGASDNINETFTKFFNRDILF